MRVHCVQFLSHPAGGASELIMNDGADWPIHYEVFLGHLTYTSVTI